VGRHLTAYRAMEMYRCLPYRVRLSLCRSPLRIMTGSTAQVVMTSD